MKLICNVEILRDFSNSMVYVYKIDQIHYAKRNIDIRDIINELFSKLYVRNIN